MTRASWGSSTGDLSGLFTGLMDENRRRIEADVQRDIQRSKEQQNAEDNDMYDKWQNGIITDQEWLHYVHQRVNETKGFPEEHEQWVKTYREQRTAIQDAQMEARYADGTISIHKLIAHYGDRMASVERNSPAYRDQQQRYYQLIDQRDSYYIEDTANRILNKIQRGQAGYGELRDFYQSMLGKVRKSSPLYRQIKQNLQSIATIGGATSGGSSSGGSGGSSSRGGGGSADGSNDPYSVASRAVVKLWKSGNVFVPAGPDVVRSVLQAYNMDTRDDTTVWNALGEDSVVIENLMEQAKDPNAKFLVTPWGDRIPNDLEHRHMLMNQGLRLYDYRIALGNSQGRSILGVQSARTSFVDNTFKTENDANAEDYWKQSRQEFWESVELAGQQPDPTEAMNMYANAGRTFERRMARITGQPVSTVKPLTAPEGRYEGKAMAQDGVNAGEIKLGKSRLFPEEQVTDDMKEQIDYAMQLSNFLRESPNMTPEELQHESSILFDARPESFWLGTTELQGIIGTDQTYKDENGFNTRPIPGTGLIGKAFAQRGLVAASIIDAGIPSAGSEAYRYVGVPGQTAPVPVPESKIGDYLGLPAGSDYNDGLSTIGGFEKINGRLQWVIRPLEDVPAPKWWFSKNTGTPLTADKYDKIGHDAAALQAAGFELQPVAELSNWKKVTDGDGIDWYRDPDDGHLYQGGPPFATSVFGPVFDYADFVSKDGKINMDAFRKPGSTGMGFIAFFTHDVSPHEAQDQMDTMLANGDPRINLEYFHRRDDKNFVQAGPLTPDDVIGMFWTPEALGIQFGGRTGTPVLARERIEAQQQMVRDNAEARRKAEVQGWIAERIGNQKQQGVFNATNPDINLNDVASQQIEQAKAIAGIKLGSTLRENKIRQMPPPDVRIAPPPAIRPPTPIAPVPVKPAARKRGTFVPDYADSGKARNIPTF